MYVVDHLLTKSKTPQILFDFFSLKESEQCIFLFSIANFWLYLVCYLWIRSDVIGWFILYKIFCKVQSDWLIYTCMAQSWRDLIGWFFFLFSTIIDLIGRKKNNYDSLCRKIFFKISEQGCLNMLCFLISSIKLIPTPQLYLNVNDWNIYCF